MEDFKYRDYSITPLGLEDLLDGSNPRDGWAQTFEVSGNDKKFYIRLGIANPTLAQISKSIKELPEIFQEGVEKVIDLLNREKEKINEWNYFEYDRSGEWMQTNEEF